MRIVINGWFIDRPHTGSGQYLRQLIARLPVLAPQHEVHLIVPQRRSFAVIDLNPDSLGGLANTHTAELSNYTKLLFEQSLVPRAANALQADLVHVPYWAPPLRSRAPIVVTIHDLIPVLLSEYRGGPLARMYTGLVGAAARGAALILTDSDASRRDIIQHLGVLDSRVRTVYLAADSQFTPRPDALDRAAVRKKYDLPDEYVLYLGGFDPRNNIETALQVYTWGQDAIGETHPLVIAGRLPAPGDRFASDPRQIARLLEIEDVVRCIGEVDEEDKVALYQGATAFLYPSRYEGFGLPALEALAFGTPVVGSNAGSVPEIVGDAGMLVSPDDARAMAGALIAVVSDPPLRDALSQRALVQAARFSWDATVRQTVEAYESVIR